MDDTRCEIHPRKVRRSASIKINSIQSIDTVVILHAGYRSRHVAHSNRRIVKDGTADYIDYVKVPWGAGIGPSLEKEPLMIGVVGSIILVDPVYARDIGEWANRQRMIVEAGYILILRGSESATGKEKNQEQNVSHKGISAS